MKLLLNIGFQADAAAVNMWRTAQEFWGKGRNLIPKEVFDKLEFAEALISAGLADVRESFIYVRGCSEYLEWHAEKREQASKAGKKSAEVRRKKNGSAQPKGGKGSKTSEQPPNAIRTDVNGTEPSDSHSGSDSLSGSSSEKLHPPVAAESSKELRLEIWDRYSNAFFTRYKTDPVRNASVNSKIKLLAERLGDEAKDVVEFYVTHNNAFYVRSTHSIGLCLQDAEGLRTQWATGRMTSQKEAQQADSSTALATQLKKIREGSL